jgi:hypothetical protein
LFVFVYFIERKEEEEAGLKKSVTYVLSHLKKVGDSSLSIGLISGFSKNRYTSFVDFHSFLKFVFILSICTFDNLPNEIRTRRCAVGLGLRV